MAREARKTLDDRVERLVADDGTVAQAHVSESGLLPGATMARRRTAKGHYGLPVCREGGIRGPKTHSTLSEDQL